MLKGRIISFAVFTLVLFAPSLVRGEELRGGIKVTPANSSRFEYRSKSLVCYGQPGRVSKTAGEFRKVKKKVKKKWKKQLTFYSLKTTQAAALADLKRKLRGKSASKLRLAQNRHRDEMKRKSQQCNTNLDFALRWFPSNDAKGYYLYLENFSGQVVNRQEVIPHNCTHRLIEGYTAGVCELEVDSPASGHTHYIRLSAYGPQGESTLTRVALP